MKGRYWKAARALAILLLAMACTSPVPPTLSPSAAPTTVSSQAPADTPAPRSPQASLPPAPSGQSTGEEGLRLNEVRFAPAAGEPAFVEVANTSAGPIDVAGATLRLTDRDLQLANAPTLPAGGLLLVLLDGLDSVEGSVIHGPSGLNLPPDRGRVELLALDGTPLDRIAWGNGDPGAVASGPGGIVPEGFTAGSTIARAAGTTTPGAPLEWVTSAAATPGSANPAPTVSVMLPLSGAILDPGAADLFWYPVPGASSYRVQVATEPAFASPVMDITGTEAQVSVANLAPGAYFWRIQAIPADGTESPFSEPADFELAAAGTALARASALQGAVPGTRGMRLAGVAVDTPGKQLAVPVIGQHKDTAMLLLEDPIETGGHAWDVDHHSLDPNDPADSKNCALAMIAMVSAFYGGGLSQDRIGYEVISHRAGNPTGPEGDLMYGYGTNGVEAWEAFKWALGDVTVPGLMTFEDMWTIVVREIDAGRPVAAANSHHGFVITGYEVTGGRRLITVNDPWPGRTYKQDIDRIRRAPSDFNFFLMPASPNVRQQEASVTTDSDGDGVVDFDETERFGTNPNNNDGDGDKLPDKQDIVTGVFDPQYGYATTGRPFGRDYDSDGIPTERDKDSDEGGCLDGIEDANGNGHRDQPETSNFNGDDDQCTSDAIVLQGTIRGTGTETPNYVNTLYNGTEGRIEVTMEVTITITLDDWTSTGTATVSGEYTGDCVFSDSDSGPMVDSGMRISEPTDPTDMIAYVEVFASDPRFTQRPLTGLYLSVFGRTAGEGGTCGHTLGPVEDASPPLQVTLAGCTTFEILNNNGTWHGECTESSDINPGTGQPYSEQHWTANLEQTSPRETPAPGP